MSRGIGGMARRFGSGFGRSLLMAAILGALAAPGAAIAQESPAEEPPGLRELAERLLLPARLPGPATLGPGGSQLVLEDPAVELRVGEIALELGQDVPLPPGSRVVGSVVRRGGLPLFGLVEVVLDVPGTLQEVTDYFERVYAEQGGYHPMHIRGARPGAASSSNRPRRPRARSIIVSLAMRRPSSPSASTSGGRI